MKRKITALLMAVMMTLALGTAAFAAEASVPEEIYLVTNVFGDGQKAWYVVLDYGAEIDPASVDKDDFSVESYDIEAVYVSGEAAIPAESAAGSFVIVELSTAYTTTGYGGPGVGSSASADEGRDESNRPTGDLSEETGFGRGEMSGGPSGGPGGMTDLNVPSNQITVTIQQVGEIETTDGAILAAWDEAVATDYEENVNLLVEDFEQLVYTADDGTELMYNLYVPENTDEALPLVLFMPDATGEGSDPVRTLTESRGSVCWATEEWQSEHPCIVLCPQYESSNGDDLTYTVGLVQYIVDNYNVDESRIYTVGQSSGTIRSIKLMIDYPELFAAGMLVAGQGQDGYEERLGELAGQTIWLICSAGDARAYPGMTAIVDAVEAEGTSVTVSQWSADLPDEEQEVLAAEQASAGTSINWTVYDAATVMEDDVNVSDATEHMNTWRVSYDLDTVREWLFEQTKA